MGLRGDWEEVRTAWAKTSGFGRIGLALSAFLGVSSLAGLSEQIIKWRGVFADALIFYAAWVSEPLMRLASRFNISLSRIQVDYCVVSLVIAGCMFRTGLLAFPDRPATKFAILRLWLAEMSLAIAIFIGLLLSMPSYRTVVASNYYRGHIIILVLMLLMSKRIRFFRIFLIQLFLLIATVLFMGAINAGLTK